MVLTTLFASPPLPRFPAGYGAYPASGYDYRYASLAAAGYSGSELGMGAEQARAAAAAALPAAMRAAGAASSAPLVVQEVPLKQAGAASGAGAGAGGGPTEEELMKSFRERLYRSRGGTAEEEGEHQHQQQEAAAAQEEGKQVRGLGAEVDSRSCRLKSCP